MVECNLAKVEVAGSNPVSRSKYFQPLLPRRSRGFCYAVCTSLKNHMRNIFFTGFQGILNRCLAAVCRGVFFFLVFVLAVSNLGFLNVSAVSAAELRLLAATFPIYHLAQRVSAGQSGISLELMLPAGTGCPHDYALTPQDMQKVAAADVLLVNGLGLESFLVDRLEEINPNVRVIDTSEGLEGILRKKDGAHAGSTQDFDTHGHDVNPHIFASPSMLAAMGLSLAEKLSLVYPEGQACFAGNAHAYADELHSLASDFASMGNRLKNKRIVTQHGVFDYLARDAGLEVVAVVQEQDGQEPSAVQMLALVRTIREKQAGAIFTEPQYPDKIGRTLAQESGIPVATLDPVASGPENAPADYYCTVMRHNLAVLEKTLGTE